MSTTIQERVRLQVREILAGKPAGLSAAEINRAVRDALCDEEYSRAILSDVLAEMESASQIDSDRRAGVPHSHLQYFLCGKGPGGRVRVVPASTVPLPPMEKQSWVSPLDIFCLTVAAQVEARPAPRSTWLSALAVDPEAVV